jgi:hypothetical protein
LAAAPRAASEDTERERSSRWAAAIVIRTANPGLDHAVYHKI